MAWILVGRILEAITGDEISADIGRAIVWTALDLHVDVVPAPGPAVDDWQQTLDVLTLAASAAATVLTVLAAGGGGRQSAFVTADPSL